MRVRLKYGSGWLDVDLPVKEAAVIEPSFVPGLPDAEQAFRVAVRAPAGARPLRHLVAARDRLAIVIPDVTRPFPGRRILPWLLAEINHVPAGQITIINGTGSHRANTPAELEQMLGPDIVRRYRIVNHNAHDAATLRLAGRLGNGREIHMNRDYVAADKRIVLGFVEPHFMAGFSGGYKAVCPGVIGIDDIMFYHRAELIGHPLSTWGVLDGNPTQAFIRECGALLPVHFCVNVTLNRDGAITGVFAGDTLTAHRQACAFSKQSVMQPVRQSFDLVLTTNGGYPLDQSLYQAVKGMSAACRIVTPGGYILCAAECRDGFPAHGNFKQLLFDHASPGAILKAIGAPGFSLFDQWEAQVLALIAVHARVGLYSRLAADDVRRAHLEPVGDIAVAVGAEIARRGSRAALAVLPEGPFTVPYPEGT